MSAINPHLSTIPYDIIAMLPFQFDNLTNRNELKKQPPHSQIDPEEWLDKYGDALYRFALARVCDPDAAEDLVQETLVSAFRSAEKFEGRSEEKTWLIGIIRRKIADHFQKVGREKSFRNVEADLQSMSDDWLCPAMSAKAFESSLEKAEFWEAVETCIRELPTYLREAFVQRITNDDLSVSQICDELGISSQNFGIRLYRARLMLRYCIEKRWLE
ncbi:sigma-70 family RNA polymerase sigma factor [Vicingaceae bacterium]|nr:sigma-70 family RNA polymerase sigma factor [Vicingaceae bacterium]